MWLFVSDGFLSIVAHRDYSDHLLVRSRHPDHIEALFSDAEIIFMPSADYPYRAVLPRQVVQLAVNDYFAHMRYDNFKNSILDYDYHEACKSVWRKMDRYGEKYRRGDL